MASASAESPSFNWIRSTHSSSISTVMASRTFRSSENFSVMLTNNKSYQGQTNPDIDISGIWHSVLTVDILEGDLHRKSKRARKKISALPLSAFGFSETSSLLYVPCITSMTCQQTEAPGFTAIVTCDNFKKRRKFASINYASINSKLVSQPIDHNAPGLAWNRCHISSLSSQQTHTHHRGLYYSPLHYHLLISSYVTFYF